MPRPIPVPIRHTVFRLWEQHHTPVPIAQTLGLSCVTVRRLVRRFRLRGVDGIAPDYSRTHPALDSDIAKAAVRWRREHPTWGAGLIRVPLRQEASGRPLPSTRTLQRWFLPADLAPAPAGRRTNAPDRRATVPHETWQRDAQERISIKTGEQVSWLRLVDEGRGAALWTAVSPLGRWNQVTAAAVRDQMRQAVCRWGLPVSLRVDHGAPWGSRGEWPTELALGALGVGIRMIGNRPRQPPENGVIERSPGTADRWCEPWTCDAPAEWPARLERRDGLYREFSPDQDGRSRAACFPAWAHSGRASAVESEGVLWDWTRVTASLSSGTVVRPVDHRGFVSMYKRLSGNFFL